jgi:hypothetical protein
MHAGALARRLHFQAAETTARPLGSGVVKNPWKGAKASQESQMVKRSLLAFTFIAAVGIASLGIGTKAMAWSNCGSSPYAAAYPYPYYASYGAGWGPRVAYYPSVPVVRSYPVYYGHDHHRHHDHHHNGVRISFGF